MPPDVSRQPDARAQGRERSAAGPPRSVDGQAPTGQSEAGGRARGPLGRFDLVGVVNPGSALDAGTKFLGIWRRRSERKQQAAAIAADHRIETTAESFAEAARIAESLAAVGRAGTPVILTVEDAHWADAGLASLLRHLLELERAPVLIITTAWPEKLADDEPTAGTFAGWLRQTERRGTGQLERISLDPLPATTLADLVLDVAPRTPPATAERIAETAGGNPLVLNLLLDLDVVRRDIAADGRIDTSPDDLRRLPSRRASSWSTT